MALRRLHETGDTDRVAELRTADLSAEPILVDELLHVLRDGLPRKLLGVTVRRKTGSLTQIIEGLSSTPTAAVRRALMETAERFPREPFGLEASKVLAGFDAPRAPERPEAGPESAAAPAPAPQGMEGDLKIFGLPNLLQSLGQNEVTGTLTLRDRRGTPVGVLDLRAGELAFCSTGRLQGAEAFYQLLERPLATSFQLTSGDPPRREARAGEAQRPLVAMLLEGMRRYDEYERACALVPDTAVLVPTGTRPTSVPGETDGVFVRNLWSQVKGGATAAACEEALATDAYRVRALLAHWLAEGAVEASRFDPPPATP
jgi:hypothetical protein